MSTRMIHRIIARYYGPRVAAEDHEAVGGPSIKMLKPLIEDAARALDEGDQDDIERTLGKLKSQLGKLNLKLGL